MRGRRDGHYSGRYASYWNAFLFTSEIILLCDGKNHCKYTIIVAKPVCGDEMKSTTVVQNWGMKGGGGVTSQFFYILLMAFLSIVMLQSFRDME